MKILILMFLLLPLIVLAEQPLNVTENNKDTAASTTQVKPKLDQAQFKTLLEKTLIVPISVGTYLNKPGYFGFVGFKYDLVQHRNVHLNGEATNQTNQTNQIETNCNFIKQNHSLYFLDQESYQINRIPNYPMPNARDYLAMSIDQLQEHVNSLSNKMQEYCANVNMFPVIEFGFYEVNHGSVNLGMRNLAQSDKKIDEVLDWSKQYASLMHDHQNFVTYKHYPFAFDDMWIDSQKYCDQYKLFSECTALKINKTMEKKVLKVLNSMPDYAMLMYGNFIYVNAEDKGEVAVLDPQWKGLIERSQFKGLVISDDIAQIMDFKNYPETFNQERLLRAWKNVDVLMLLYDYVNLDKLENWLYDAYLKGLITDSELNTKIDKINSFNQKAILNK